MKQRPNLPDLLQHVIAAAEDTGRMLAEEFVRLDGPRGAAGDADVDDEIEATLRKRLLELLPAHWRGEETGVLEGAGGRYCWLVDPYDGTSAFLAGERGSSVSIALLNKGVPVLGGCRRRNACLDRRHFPGVPAPRRRKVLLTSLTFPTS